MINIEHRHLNKIKTDENSYKNILIYYISKRYVAIKDSKYVKIKTANSLYLIIRKMNGYFEEINENKCFTLVPTTESKEIIKHYKEFWSKIRDLIRSITKNSDDYDETYMKIRFNSNDDLPLNKTQEIHNMIVAVCSCHVTYAFQSESTLYSCLNFKELLVRSRREI